MSGLNLGAVKNTGAAAAPETNVKSKAKKAEAPPHEGTNPGEGKDMTAVAKPANITVMAVTGTTAGDGVPSGSVSVDGIRNANKKGALIRFAPATEEAGAAATGDGYFAGGATDVDDKATAMVAAQMKKMGMDDPTEFLSQDAWNQRLGNSLYAGVGMTVSAAQKSETMAGVLNGLSGMKVRVLEAGQSAGGSAKSYNYEGHQTFRKLGRGDLAGMREPHQTTDLATIATHELGAEFADLPDTPENRGKLVRALTGALVGEISHALNHMAE